MPTCRPIEPVARDDCLRVFQQIYTTSLSSPATLMHPTRPHTYVQDVLYDLFRPANPAVGSMTGYNLGPGKGHML